MFRFPLNLAPPIPLLITTWWTKQSWSVPEEQGRSVPCGRHLLGYSGGAICGLCQLRIRHSFNSILLNSITKSFGQKGHGLGLALVWARTSGWQSLCQVVYIKLGIRTLYLQMDNEPRRKITQNTWQATCRMRIRVQARLTWVLCFCKPCLTSSL